MSITNFASKELKDIHIVTIESCIENIGNVKIEPKEYYLTVSGVSFIDKIKEAPIYKSANLLQDKYITPGSWYLEPQQID